MRSVPRCKLVVRVSNLTLYTPNSRGGGKPHMTIAFVLFVLFIYL